MPTDEPNSLPGYADTADAYWNLGWRGVLPLPPKSKVWPPRVKCDDARARRPCKPRCACVHYTGYSAVEPSGADIAAWKDQYPDGNLCLHLRDGIVGIDVDAYDHKTGREAFAEAIRRWGPLPPATRTTSRADGVSGIRLFRVPVGTMLETRINFPELGIGDIEIVQSHHRYAISWPSIHPDTGEVYRWLDDDDQPAPLPSPDLLPELPQAWIEGLRRQSQRFEGEINVDVHAALTDGDPSPGVQTRLGEAIKALQRPGASRHDTCCRHVLALCRLGISGEPGVKRALQILCEVLVAVRRVDGSNTPEGTRAEFIRMLTNDQLARELSRPGITDWIGLLVADEIRSEKDPAVGDDQVGTPTIAPAPASVTEESNAGAGDDGGAVIVDDSAPRSHLEEIERGFWSSRESLTRIWQTSIAQMASPWATLGICAARALTRVRPNATLPPLIGGPGSLNLFVALVARSGGGKGAAGAAANLLIPSSTFVQRNLGSGEGLVKLFDRPKADDGSAQRHEALLINVDEVDTIAAMGQRTASTTTSVLRSAFSGEALGWAYVNRSGLGDIPEHSYRMTLVVSVQPARAGGLLDGEGGGLPQRFMWFPAKDSRIVDEPGWPGGPLELPPNTEWLYSRTVPIPDEVARFIRANRAADMRDEVDALDGHAVFCREKFAYALAVLDGRAYMTMEDWELSGIAADVSTFTREQCRDHLREAARIDALDRGEIRGIELHAADDAKQMEAAEKMRRVIRRVVDKVTAAGEEGITRRDIDRSTPHRDRRWLDGALGLAASNGLIAQREGTTVWFRL